MCWFESGTLEISNVWPLALTFIWCVTLSNLLSLLNLSFLICKMGIIIVLLQGVPVGIQWNNTWKGHRTVPGTLYSQEKKLTCLFKINILFKNISIYISFFKKRTHAHFGILAIASFLFLVADISFWLCTVEQRRPTWKPPHTGFPPEIGWLLWFLYKVSLCVSPGRISSPQQSTAPFPHGLPTGEEFWGAVWLPFLWKTLE